MIIWRGRGLVIAVITFCCVLLSEIVTEAWFRDVKYYQAHGWPKLVGFWAAAWVVYALRARHGVGQERTLIDNKTGQEMLVPIKAYWHPRRMTSEDALFFVPARFWPAILLALGFVFFFVVE